jgi:hypothetical protein
MNREEANMASRVSFPPATASGTMRKISSKVSSSIQLFPFVFFGFLTFLCVLLLMNGALQQAPVFLVVLGAISVGGFFIWKKTLRDVMDEVYDCGDYLSVRKHREEDTILLSNIIDVNFTVNRDGTGARITLTLESPGKFGGKILFAPPSQFELGPLPEKIARDLAARADQARNRHPI